MAERLTPERSVRLLRAKAAELESMVPSYLDEIKVVNPNHFAQDIRKLYEMAGNTLADIALVAGLLADHMERSEQHDEQLRRMYKYLANIVIPQEAEERLTTVVVQHDASFNEPVIETEMTDPKDRLAKLPWVKFDTPGPGQPGDASDAT